MISGPVPILGMVSQRLQRILCPQGPVFRGWWVVGSGALANFFGAILFMQAFGAYVLLIEAEYEWSKAALAGAFALARLESGLLGPIQGWMIDRFGPRKIMRIGLVIFSLGMIMFSQIDTILDFYIVVFVIALGNSLGGFLSITVAVVNWFNRHRAKALALGQLGFSIGGVLVPITIFSMETFGWRATAVGSGVIMLLVTWPVTHVIHHRPEELGESRDGLPEPPARSRSHSKGNAARSIDRSAEFSARDAIRTRTFWWISFGHATSLLVVGAVMVHLVLHVNGSLGYSLGIAGLIVALVTFMQILGQLVISIVGDRLNKRMTAAICMGVHAAGLLLLAYAQNIAMVVCFAVLHGIAWGVRGPLMQALRADYFGTASFGTIMGWSSLVVMIGMSVGPIFAGWMADLTGTYTLGFNLLALASLLGSVFFMLAKKPPLPAGRRAPG
ncbi:MAG: MFS transporter [Pseudomonadota bacterium]|nr:MFS transporter [Pseudomonadota bacterium]